MTAASGRLHGALAAAVTPLRDGGDALDEEAIGPLVDFYAASPLDGLLALGTTGEGILLSFEERRRAAEAFVAAAGDRLDVAVHCGAQTTADTVALSAHAAEHGAAAVAVIGPPYFALGDDELLRHFEAAARACAPVPFYLYEFADRSGYAFPPELLPRLRERAPNLVGLKVSDSPFERLEPYLVEGFDVFVGAEALIHRASERGAAGTVSGLASAFPAPVAAAVRAPSRESAASLGVLRDALRRFPTPSVFKHVLRERGLSLRGDVRAPLRDLTADELAALRALPEIERGAS